MPKSLTPVESEAYEQILPQTEIFVKVKPKTTKTTVQMVQNALVELHNIKGITLKQIYKYILHTYKLELISNFRAILIKKYLKSLWETNDVANITGKGLTGHFKLVNKNMFSKEITINHDKTRETKRLKDVKSKSRITNSAKNNHVPVERKKAKNSKKRQLYSSPVIPEHVTTVPLNINKSSMFDTPMVPTQVQASTPFIRTAVPRAPHLRKRVYKIQEKTIPQDDNGTPRSSLTEKPRKVLKRHNK